MKLAVCSDGGAPFWAVVDPEADAARPISGGIADWGPGVTRGEGEAALRFEGPARALSTLRLLAPCERTSKVVIAGQVATSNAGGSASVFSQGTNSSSVAVSGSVEQDVTSNAFGANAIKSNNAGSFAQTITKGTPVTDELNVKFGNSVVVTDGVDRRLDSLSERTALTIAPSTPRARHAEMKT